MEPENPILWLNMGIAQQKAGEYEEALESYREVLRIDDNIADAWASMAMIFFELKQIDKAKKHYKIALEKDSASFKTWNNLGVLYFSEVKYEKARICFEEALKIMPMFYDALYNLRDTCRELEDYRAAAEFEILLKGINSKNFT